MAAASGRGHDAPTRIADRRMKWTLLVLGAIGLVALLAALTITGPARDTGQLDRLKSLPYVEWSGEEVDNSRRRGVVVFDPERASPGINVLALEHRPGGSILDMKGRQLVTFTDRRTRPRNWKLIEPLSDDRFLILAEGIMLIDRRSDILWQIDADYHHDIDIDADGKIYTLSRRPEYWPELNRLRKTINDYLIILDSSGRVLKEISFIDIVLADPVLEARALRYRGAIFDLAEDLFHANTVEIIPEDVYIDGQLVFKRGHVLICWRNLDLVGALDPESESLTWHWGFDELDAPHQPTLLDNGNLLIFDNGRDKGFSRVIELNPLTKTIEWEYQGDPPESFYTASRGGAQRLPNGNTLITDSDSGRGIEIDPSGEGVWEFLHPEIERRGLLRKLRRPVIYRMTRLDPAVDYRGNPFEPNATRPPR
jgi:hypothetical protein